MINISRDISNKLEPGHAEIIIDIVTLTKGLGFPFFIIGAIARDISCEILFGVRTDRRTIDLDFAIRVANWQNYVQLRNQMISSGRYRADTKKKQRLIHSSETLIDLVPFGPLENPSGSVAWQPDEDFIISTVGFEDALRSAIEVIVSRDPFVEAKVCTIPALAVTKIIAWNDRHWVDTKDAQDLMFLAKNYIELGNQGRLWNGDSDILTENGFDYDRASARLLGRDMSTIMSESTRRTILEILERESNPELSTRLIGDMGIAGASIGGDAFAFIIAMKQGIIESANKKSNQRGDTEEQ